MDLRPKAGDTKTGDEKTKKIAESDSKSGQNPNNVQSETEVKAIKDTTTVDRKDDTVIPNTNQDITSSSMQESSEDYKKQDNKAQKKKEITERDLNKIQFITLSETPTTYMYFLPSQRYFHLRPDDGVQSEKRNEEFKKIYANKLKNKEAFITRGIQTSNPFKRNQVVTTSDLNDQEIDQTSNQKINALNWAIFESITESRNKKDDEAKIFQKKLDKKIKRELKMKIKASEYMVNPEESYSVQRSQGQSDTFSIIETKISNSIQSSKRTRIKRPGESVDKSVDQSSMVIYFKGIIYISSIIYHSV